MQRKSKGLLHKQVVHKLLPCIVLSYCRSVYQRLLSLGKAAPKPSSEVPLIPLKMLDQLSASTVRALIQYLVNRKGNLGCSGSSVGKAGTPCTEAVSSVQLPRVWCVSTKLAVVLELVLFTILGTLGLSCIFFPPVLSKVMRIKDMSSKEGVCNTHWL